MFASVLRLRALTVSWLFSGLRSTGRSVYCSVRGLRPGIWAPGESPGTEEEALEQANRLPYGLAAFAFTENGRRINRVADGIESGMVGINSFVISASDMPFGGIKESGFGSESGPEGLDGYLVTKAVHIY